MLFGGFFIEASQIPVWLRWPRYLSFIKYGFAAAMQNEYRHRALDTSRCEGSMFCPASGDDALDNHSLNDLTLVENIVILIGLVVGMRVIAYLILRHRGPKYDKSI